MGRGRRGEREGTEGNGITTETQRARSSDPGYLRVALVLAFIIVPFSVVSFVASAISTAIRADIATGNDLAVKLRVQLGPPPSVTQAAAPVTSSPAAPPPDLNAVDVITELQLFASTIRAIDALARQLNVLVANTVHDPDTRSTSFLPS